MKVDNNHLDVVYKTLEEHRKCTEWKCEKDEKARSREEAMKWMTPEQREAFEP